MSSNNETHTEREVTMGADIYSMDDICRGLSKLTDEEKLSVFNGIEFGELINVLKKENGAIMYIEHLLKFANHLVARANAITKLLEYVEHESKMTNITAVDSIYTEMTDLEKKSTALLLMNTPEFQKHCCEILLNDFKKVIEKNPTLKAFDSLLGISNHYQKNIEANIGFDHIYEVE